MKNRQLPLRAPAEITPKCDAMDVCGAWDPIPFILIFFMYPICPLCSKESDLEIIFVKVVEGVEIKMYHCTNCGVVFE